MFNADPRREDPLYYYLREKGWGSAIGFEVAPLREEETASEVTIRVWPEHLAREADMDAAERLAMYPRVVSAFLSRFPNWSSVTLQSSRLPEFAELGLLGAAFARAGFSPSSSASNEATWTRTSQPLRPWWRPWR